MDISLIYLLIVVILPLPVAFVYALIKRANKFLIITPLVMLVLHLLSLNYSTAMGEMRGGLVYLGSCFVIAIIGTVGLYYGFIRYHYHYAETEVGRRVFACFLICCTIVVFPIVLAGFWCWAVHSLPRPTEVVKKKRPEVGERPSWGDVVKEREEEKEGGG